MIAPVHLAKMCRLADALALLAMYGIRTFPSIRAVADDSIPPFRRLPPGPSFCPLPRSLAFTQGGRN
jgi:hypothetical protein